MAHINSYKYYKDSGNFDVVHFTNYAMPFIKNKKTKYVVTVHDLAAFLHPETFSGSYTLYSQFIINLAVRKADVILTVSESVRKEIIQKWPQYADKVKVAYPGLYSEFDNRSVPKQYDSEILRHIQRKKFFLFSGTLELRKNLGIIIRAFVQMKEKNKDNDYKLVLVGRPGFGYEEYKRLIDEAACKDDILVTGYVSSNDLVMLYKEAAAYVFPSVYEGFGSTQLECMTNHLPLILSDIPTNREVSGEYGLFFKLGDVDELEERMQDIILQRYDTDIKNRIADKSCSQYSWESVIESYMEAYR